MRKSRIAINHLRVLKVLLARTWHIHMRWLCSGRAGAGACGAVLHALHLQALLVQRLPTCSLMLLHLLFQKLVELAQLVVLGPDVGDDPNGIL